MNLKSCLVRDYMAGSLVTFKPDNWLRQDLEGHGLITEAAQASVEFAFHRMKVHRIRCAAATGNHRSLRVIARLGFHFEGIARQAEYVGSRWVDHAVFSRLATDE